MKYISQGLISPLVSKDLLKKADSRLEALEVASWILLLNLEQDELPEFRMKDNLFSS